MERQSTMPTPRPSRTISRITTEVDLVRRSSVQKAPPGGAFISNLPAFTEDRPCCLKQNPVKLRCYEYREKVEDPMKLKVILAAFALIGAGAMVATSADAQTAQTKKKTVVYNRDRTVIVSRDEDGRTRTRIIIQKRSYLDPGTESFPGERSDHFYAQLPNQRAGGVIDNTSAGLLNTQSALPGPWTLPSKNNPWLFY